MLKQRKDSFMFDEIRQAIVPPGQIGTFTLLLGEGKSKATVLGHIGYACRLCMGDEHGQGEALLYKEDLLVLGKALIELAEHTNERDLVCHTW